MKKIILANDHGAVEMKQELATRLAQAGYQVENCGVDSPSQSVDYPDMAKKGFQHFVHTQGDLCIFLCGTGLGIGIAANKLQGARAATCSDCFSAKMAREHNDANILCLGARVLGIELAWEITQAFLQAEFQGGRHQERVNKITALELR